MLTPPSLLFKLFFFSHYHPNLLSFFKATSTIGAPSLHVASAAMEFERYTPTAGLLMWAGLLGFLGAFQANFNYVFESV